MESTKQIARELKSLELRIAEVASKVKALEAKFRLEALRAAIVDECISYGELVELESLAPYIEEGDTLLLQWANVPEFE
tara:strand:+ start:213 stop:449 length:237 start_codon:yes stop_codon:yes gene_type:complete